MMDRHEKGQSEIRRQKVEAIAEDLRRLEKEAAEIGEGFLAFLIASAGQEAENRIAAD